MLYRVTDIKLAWQMHASALWLKPVCIGKERRVMAGGGAQGVGAG